MLSHYPLLIYDELLGSIAHFQVSHYNMIIRKVKPWINSHIDFNVYSNIIEKDTGIGAFVE